MWRERRGSGLVCWAEEGIPDWESLPRCAYSKERSGVGGIVSKVGKAGGVGRRLLGSEIVVKNGARVEKVVVVLGVSAPGSDGEKSSNETV